MKDKKPRQLGRGQPGYLRQYAYNAIHYILFDGMPSKTWMNIDSILGAIQSGVNEAMAEFVRSKIRGDKKKCQN